MIVDVLPFDTTQVTSDKNYSHPTWGGCCHPLASEAHPPAVVIRSKDMELVMATGQANAEIMWGGCPTLNNNHEQPVMMSDRKGHNGITEDGTATTLNAQEKERPVVGTSIVRRLTPKECERLQGMPDDWSRWGVNEKGEVYELADTARYRLQGNGIATPFWRWLMKRISAQYERTPTLGSLFDGQASFPMIWEGINGPGTALWSSEIEKHAVAVAKYHFPEE